MNDLVRGSTLLYPKSSPCSLGARPRTEYLHISVCSPLGNAKQDRSAYIQMGESGRNSEVTYDSLEQVLRDDTKVKVAGIDIDGVLRGKLISKKKFLGIAKDGFGFCSVIFGWDMHDQTYFKELKISNAENGYHDIVAVPDLSTFRRIPWEDNVPFFLVSFLDPGHRGPISACPRGLLKTVADKLEEHGLGAMAGGERYGHYRSPCVPESLNWGCYALLTWCNS